MPLRQVKVDWDTPHVTAVSIDTFNFLYQLPFDTGLVIEQIDSMSGVVYVLDIPPPAGTQTLFAQHCLLLT